MRFGLIPYLNGKPLDYGLRTSPGLCTNQHCDLTEALPAQLYAGLSEDRLDAALISSVECLRNEAFSYCKTVGVCARKKVRSILYIRRRDSIPADEITFAKPGRVLMDNGSRTSVALLNLLLKNGSGVVPENSLAKASEIPSRLRANEGGLLIGDAALEFWNRPDLDCFVWKDLCEWWFERESLPFIFALWAYPARSPILDSVFEKSLEIGQANLESIIAQSHRSDAREYLTEIIHYKTTEDDKNGLTVFGERLREAGLF